MVKVPRDEKKGIRVLCLQPAHSGVDDVTGRLSGSRWGNIRSYRDNMREFPWQIVWPHANRYCRVSP